MIKFSPAIDGTIPRVNSKPYTMVSGQNERMAGSVPVFDLSQSSGAEDSSVAENLADGEPSIKQEDSSFGFADLVDIINPLQHIPFVSQLYQSATGDEIGSVAQIVGGALFGGPIGALTSAGMVALKAARDHQDENPFQVFEGTTIAVADLRQGFKPYNT